MKKVLLILIVVGGIAFLEPRSRTQIMKVVRPATEPIRQRSAERALVRIAKDVQKTADEVGLYPQPEVFDQWLLQTYRSATDPWGTEYYLEVFGDSIVVASPGPDARKHTADDVRLARRRSSASTAFGDSYAPPAPPSSSVKTSTIRKANQAANRKPD